MQGATKPKFSIENLISHKTYQAMLMLWKLLKVQLCGVQKKLLRCKTCGIQESKIGNEKSQLVCCILALMLAAEFVLKFI